MADTLTFGCRLNAAESDTMGRLADSAGWAHALIVNTCAVTGEAEAQARQAIRRAVREQPGRPILVTGCAAQIAPQAWAALPGVARVIGQGVKLDPAARLRAAGEAQRDVFLSARMGQIEEVLMEADQLGHTAHGVPIRHAAPPGTLLRLRAAGRTGRALLGEAA